LSDAPKITDLPEGPERTALLKEFGNDADILTVAKGFIDTKTKMSSTRRVPSKDAPAADWDSFYNNLGRPEKAIDYKLPETPNGLKPVLESLRDVAWQRGLTQEQFEALASQAATVASEADGKVSAARKEWETKLREKLGDKADRRIQDADASLKELLKDDPQAMEVIRQSGLDKHPAVANLLLKVRDALGDDTAPIGASPSTTPGPTGVEIQQKIQTLINSAEFKTPHHPNHQAVNLKIGEHIHELIAMGYSGPEDPRIAPQKTIRIPDGQGGFTTIPVPVF
jgi:hypothetical protein